MTTPLNARDLLLSSTDVPRLSGTDLSSQTNRVYVQRTEPFSTNTYELRLNDVWVDQGSKNYGTFTSEFSAANGYSIGTTAAGNMDTTILNEVIGPLPYLTGSNLVADRFVENTATAGHYIAKAINWAIVGVGAHTVSIYAKAVPGSSLRYLELVVLAGVAGTNKFASFDIVNGKAGDTTTGVVASSCAAVGNGWFRCSITVDILVANNSFLQIRLSDVNTSFGHAYTGNGSSIYAWGFMVEANTTHPGRYIENDTSSVPGLLDTTGSNVLYTWNGSYWLSAQLKELDDLSSDNVLTPAEKLGVIKERDAILAEEIQLINQSTVYGSALTAQLATYTAAVDTLTAYLASLNSPYMWDDIASGHNTTIVGSTFRTNFVTYYTARDVFKNALNTEASKRATWNSTNITGSTRPEDNANNIGVSSESPPNGGFSLISSLDAASSTYLLRALKSINRGLDLSLDADAKTIQIEAHSSERDHILLSSDNNSSSASLVDVPGMEFAAVANTKYYITGTVLIYTTTAGATWQLAMTGPAGATVNMPLTTGSAPNGQVYPFAINAIVSIGGTAGLIKLQFASGDTKTVTLKQDSLLVLNEVVNVTPPVSGGYVIDTSPALGTAYTSMQTTTAGGCTASISLTAKTNGTVTITVGSGDSLTGTPTSDTWATSGTGDQASFEVLFTYTGDTNSPVISNGASSYTKLDSNRLFTVTRSCSYGQSAQAYVDVTITIRKIGTTTPVYTDTTRLYVDVASENPYL